MCRVKQILKPAGWDWNLLPRRDACDRRGNRRTPRQDPGAVSGDRYTPAEIRLPVMRGPIEQAPAQERLIKSGIPTENLVADVVVDKYAWHKPFYRQAQIMRLEGLPVDRSEL